ncbi:MAG: class I SAM-dependent methyltransferase [Candidatus Pacebacteria bacterium]|nr:class I SAM-dependent methyltransferase [Candidatus Paceibacterota bacterium]MDD5356620.1 class I SAM-dependent methyltransferase [Candidatus Paceibacterota bacterium]
MKKKDTSWGNVAGWYDELLSKDSDSYQSKVILPNLLRLMEIKKGEWIFDIACGQGFFSREFVKAGANVVGSDIAPELIAIAKKDAPKEAIFHVAPSDDISFEENESFDKVVCILALQNIEKLSETLAEASRILRKTGKLYLVLNHPAFRIPQKSGWEFDEKKKIQFRRVDEYLSESRTEIDMHPGQKESEHTVSFHRSLQVYFKMFRKNNLAVTRLEEWISHKASQKGPRAVAEDKARKEIPLFLFLEIVKI